MANQVIFNVVLMGSRRAIQIGTYSSLENAMRLSLAAISHDDFPVSGIKASFGWIEYAEHPILSGFCFEPSGDLVCRMNVTIDSNEFNIIGIWKVVVDDVQEEERAPQYRVVIDRGEDKQFLGRFYTFGDARFAIAAYTHDRSVLENGVLVKDGENTHHFDFRGEYYDLRFIISPA